MTGTRVRERRYRGVTISENYYAAGSRLVRPKSATAYFCLLLSGHCVVRQAARQTEIRAGSIAFHPPHEEHALEVLADMQCVNVDISGDSMDRLRDVGPGTLRLTVADRGPLLWSATRILAELRTWSRVSPLIVDGIVLEMLGHLANMRRESANDRRPHWLDVAVDMLQDQLADGGTVRELALRLGVHPVHFARTFRRFNGCSVMEYRQRLRVDRACSGIAANPAVVLADLALAVGFSDQTHFSRVFKKVTGVSPGAFRGSLYGPSVVAGR